LYLRRVSLMSPDENSYSFLLWPKMMTATSTEHSTDSSWAFLNRPPLRLRKVTERLRSSLIARISIFLRPILATSHHAPTDLVEEVVGKEVEGRNSGSGSGCRFGSGGGGVGGGQQGRRSQTKNIKDFATMSRQLLRRRRIYRIRKVNNSSCSR
jgi:hypothetical protein